MYKLAIRVDRQGATVLARARWCGRHPRDHPHEQPALTNCLSDRRNVSEERKGRTPAGAGRRWATKGWRSFLGSDAKNAEVLIHDDAFCYMGSENSVADVRVVRAGGRARSPDVASNWILGG